MSSSQLPRSPGAKDSSHHTSSHSLSSQSQSGSQPDKSSSSSSSAANTSSTPSSETTYSSGMDTVPIIETQELQDVPGGSDDEAEANAWGKLHPVKPIFTKLYMVNDEYLFGRDDSCDISLGSDIHKKSYFFKAYSKVHFKIERCTTSTGVHVFLEDCSSNGTFVNGTKVGKTNRQVLQQFDEIALAHKKNKAYIYQNLEEKEESDLPKELTDHYLLTKELGKGAYGEVRLAFEKSASNPKKYAVKILSNKKLTIRGRNMVDGTSDIKREVDIMKQVNHPCIVKVFNFIETESKTFILLELVEGGELFDRVVSVGSFPEPVSKLLFYQMLLAVNYLHLQGITHRDLKPENILLADPDSDECLIKITDFGVSKLIDSKTMMKTLCGTPNYLAPEVLQSKGLGQYDNKVDCWSLGVILFICLAGYPPFSSDRTDMPLEQQITKGKFLMEKDYWKGISKEAIDLVKKLLTTDPVRRPTIFEALDHPWFNDEEMKAKVEKLMYPEGKFAAPQAVKKRPHEGGEPPSKAQHVSAKKPGSPEKAGPSSPKKGSPTKKTAPQK